MCGAIYQNNWNIRNRTIGNIRKKNASIEAYEFGPSEETFMKLQNYVCNIM